MGRARKDGFGEQRRKPRQREGMSGERKLRVDRARRRNKGMPRNSALQKLARRVDLFNRTIPGSKPKKKKKEK